jgi:tetratricopeptide (TPR) repeat protein
MGRLAMNAEQADSEELQFSELLAACDDALAQGNSVEPICREQAPTELRDELEREVEWCRLVRRLLPGTETPAQFSSVSTLSSPGQPNVASGGAAQGAFHTPLTTDLGRFQIRRELGRGGFGVVFLAFDPKLGREVALKVPRPEAIIHPELRARFQHEARAAAALDHPNLVPVYEAGEDGAVCYIASAYCPGITLARWLRERTEPVPIELAARLVATLSDAVEHAHRRGILHRDLKPSNVMLSPKEAGCVAGPPLTREDAQSMARTGNAPYGDIDFVPRIMDFGLAKYLEGASSNTLEHATHSGAIVGTPSYMAPEQAGARKKAVGPVADVYALGAILYEVLTGRPPFAADTIAETLLLVRTEEPLAPAKLRRGIPRDLETICLTCLHKDADKRYPTAAVLGEDLRRFLAREPITARRASRWERTVKWARRRPALAALIAVSVAAMLVVAAIVLIAYERLRTERDMADAARREALAGYKKARQAVDQMLRRVGLNLLPDVPHTELIQRGLLEDALKFYQALAKLRSDDPELREETGTVYREMGAIYGMLGQSRQALEAFRQALETHRALAAEMPGELRYRHAAAVSRQVLGANMIGKAEFQREAEQHLRQAHAELVELAAENPQSVSFKKHLAAAWASLGELLYRTGRSTEADKAYRQAIDLREKLATEFPADRDNIVYLARVSQYQGMMHAQAKRFDKAEEAFRRALDLCDQLAATAPPGTPSYRMGYSPLLFYNYGVMLTDRRRYPEAEKLYLRALDFYEKLAADFPNVPYNRAQLAHTLFLVSDLRLRHLKQFQQARQGVERAIGYQLKLCEAEPQNTDLRRNLRRQYSTLAESLIQLGEHREAAATALKLPPLFPDAWQECLSAGWFLARCLPLAQRDTRLSGSESEMLRQDYADRAVEWLRRAIQGGYNDVNFLRTSPDLEPVRRRADYQKLLRDLTR